MSSHGVTIWGKAKGFRSVAVRVCEDGTMYRADVELHLANRICTIKEAAKIVGMSRADFIASRDCLCQRQPCTYDADAGCGFTN